MVEFHVLQCAQCQTFQVMQVTKTLKWKCKLCGLKQSTLKVYGQGTGADCRRHVQKLNSLRGSLAQASEESRLLKASQSRTEWESKHHTTDIASVENKNGASSSNKWSAYIEPSTNEKDEGNASDEEHFGAHSSSKPLVTTDWSDYKNYRKQKREQNRMWRQSNPYGKKWQKSPSADKGIDTGTVYTKPKSTSWSSYNKKSGNNPIATSVLARDVSDFGGDIRHNTSWMNRKKHSDTDEIDLHHHKTNSELYPGYTEKSLSCDINIQPQTSAVSSKNIVRQKNMPAPKKPKVSTGSKWEAFIEEDEDSDEEGDEDDFSAFVTGGSEELSETRSTGQLLISDPASNYFRNPVAPVRNITTLGENIMCPNISKLRQPSEEEINSQTSRPELYDCIGVRDSNIVSQSLSSVRKSDLFVNSNRIDAGTKQKFQTASTLYNKPEPQLQKVSNHTQHGKTGVFFDLGFDLDDDCFDL